MPRRPTAAAATLDLNAQDDDFRKDVDTSKIVISAPSAVDLPENCDKFRILVVGKAGVGKSTICSAVFGVSPEQTGVSHHTVGTSREKVWDPLTFPGANENMILHDSGGFEAGDLNCVQEITNFINFRKSQLNLADQLHCIWYCISCDSNRPIESAEKAFFKTADVGKIPVVVVFTQFDRLVDKHFMNEVKEQMNRGVASFDPNHLRQLATNAAIADYDENYRGQFERVFGRRNSVSITRIGIQPQRPGQPLSASGLDNLITDTRELLLEDGLKLLWTAAQWHSADLKLQESVQVGMGVFWRAVGVGSVPFLPFVGATALYSASVKILENINAIWGIRSCRPLIKKSKVRNMFLRGCFDATVGDVIGTKFLMALNIFGPLTAAQTATMILKMIAGITLIYEKLFWRVKDYPNLEITPDVIEQVVSTFQKSDGQRRMSSHLTVYIHTGNCYSKEQCLQQLRIAVEEGRSSAGKEFLRKQTVVGQK